MRELSLIVRASALGAEPPKQDARGTTLSAAKEPLRLALGGTASARYQEGT